MELIKKVNINLPFIDFIARMPKYAGFMKDLLTNRKKMESVSSVTLNAACTVVVTNQLPEKLEDPGCYTIPCLVGDLACMRALADLGASDQKVTFAIDKAIKYPGSLDDTCYFLQTVDTHVEFLQEFSELQGTGECEIASGEEDMSDEVDLMTTLMAEGYEPTEEEHEKLEKANAYRSKTSIEEPPELELKQLPDNLEYAFLEEESKLPVIIASDLSEAGRLRLSQLNELDELRLDAYDNSLLCKERTKKWHDSRLKDPKECKEEDRVLLFNSRFKLFPGKLKSKWSGPFVVRKVYPHGAIDLVNSKGEEFKGKRGRVSEKGGTSEQPDPNDPTVWLNYLKNHAVYSENFDKIDESVVGLTWYLEWAPFIAAGERIRVRNLLRLHYRIREPNQTIVIKAWEEIFSLRETLYPALCK
ncbi:uncharacterized protein [Rutidosis leptorrhynchoides]|uniref:uncharacterized protein n=1 Tax=Rutidosis leptorrhynchoides TaxID=125765 RepID=UPI003A99E566